MNAYQGYVAPCQPDMTTTGGMPGSYYQGNELGNVVNRNRINRSMGAGSATGSKTSPIGIQSPSDGLGDMPDGESYDTRLSQI